MSENREIVLKYSPELALRLLVALEATRDSAPEKSVEAVDATITDLEKQLLGSD